MTFCEEDYNVIDDQYGSVKGSRADDYIKGSWKGDEISGRVGDDLIFGRGGEDTVHGNNGNDVLLGGDGDDKISGGKGDDFMLGGKGNDVLYMNEDFDTAYGGPGDDTLVLKDGGDQAHGGTATQNGNTFIIENTTAENGASSINDFWVDENNKIVVKDSDCEIELTFTQSDLAHCQAHNPILHIENQDCVTKISTSTSPEGSREPCLDRNLNCKLVQTEIKENNGKLREQLNFEREIVGKFKIDLFNYYLDESEQFDFVSGLNFTQFETEI